MDQAIPAEQAEAIRVKGMRRTIAKRMHESITNTAQLTLHSTIEIPELVEFKKSCLGISYTDLFVKAAAIALMRHPKLNATMMENTIYQWRSAHLGLAVALDDGLIVPTIFDAQNKSLQEIKASRQDVTTRAQSGQLAAEEVTSGTFTISNLGMYPIDAFTPILNPPQVGLLGIGRIQNLPRVRNNVILPVPVLNLSLTIDHRAVDGAPGAAFLQEMEVLFKKPQELDPE